MAIIVPIDRDESKVIRVFSAQAVAAGESAESAIVLDLGYAKGNFAAQWTLTGDGTAKIEYECSIDKATFVTPTTATEIATGITELTGPGGNGKDIAQFAPEPCAQMKFK